MAARYVGGAGQVIACEPYPSNAALLKGNLARNNCQNVRLVETALGSRPGAINLAKAGEDSGGVTALEVPEIRVRVLLGATGVSPPAPTLREIHRADRRKEPIAPAVVKGGDLGVGSHVHALSPLPESRSRSPG